LTAEPTRRARARWRPRPATGPGRLGLRWRLTLWVTAILVTAGLITFVAVYRGTGAELRAQIERELASDAGALARRAAAAQADGPSALTASARGYIRSQPFRSSSRLLFEVVPGAPTVTNEPEVLTPAGEPGESAAGQSGENALARSLLSSRPGYSTVQLPDVGPLRLLVTVVSRAGHPVVTIGAGESLASVARAQHGLAQTFLISGSLTLLGALLAGYLVAAGIARPLRRMALTAARVQAGDLSPRMSGDGLRDEVRVLAESFDGMLDRLQGAFAGQRRFIADASHELRTPLTVIGGQLEVLARQEHPSPAEVRRVDGLVRGEVLRMQRMVDDLLVLSRSEESRFLRREPLAVDGFVGELLDGLRPTTDRRLEPGTLVTGEVSADHDRLAQALRNLLVNAIEHTGSGGLVRLGADRVGVEGVRFVVDDDGPGIPAHERERVFDRFHRVDAARARPVGGTGLGLAIVRVIAEAHGGSVRAGPSPLGGARLELEIPGFAVCPAPSVALLMDGSGGTGGGEH